ncbi:MAG TPA: amino acid adenylation domain-containing protein [Ktedonobacteraceae bacterium]|nr:amino acid adenylation domain-containing protein [Ktedonobacteraceae bacterium]
MVGHLGVLLRGLTQDREKRIGEQELLTQSEREQILIQWNNTATDYPSERLIHQLFEQQVEKTPQTLAVVGKDGQLTYGDLNRQANQLARYLRTLGIAPDIGVAICMERGAEMIVAMLAVLKAGGAYVPLDPEYPLERLSYMLQDSGAKALLTQSHLQGIFASMNPDLMIVDMNDPNSQWDDQPERNLEDDGTELSARRLAYLIYTSGSTGKPKGVGIEHRNAVNFIYWARQAFAADVLQKTLFSTSLNFDLSIYESFVPLTVGGTIKVVANALECTPDTDVTLINSVPSAMAALVESKNVPRSLRVVNVAGEPLKKTLVEQIFAGTNVEIVWNLYGPTETTTYSTCVRMRRGEAFAPHVGKPIWNTQIYVLDRSMQPVPVGVVGELYIAGTGVARGYLNRSPLTAERFVPDVYGREPGARMYKTGDLARWQADGNVEFLGRNDGQVKIRGFRIEMGEIEARLRECAGVEDAVLMAREDVAGDKRLVAYYIAGTRNHGGAAYAEAVPGTEQLRAYLLSHLPEYMVPAAYVRLQSFPRTANGKLDRNALPAPEAEAYAMSGVRTPQGEVETMLAGIWADVLDREQVGRYDNFFLLGGHSLMVMRMMARVRAAFNIEVPLRLLFEKPTVQMFAHAIGELASSCREPQNEKILPISRDDRLPLSFNQEGRLLIEWWAEVNSSSYAPFHLLQAFSIAPEINTGALEKALNEIVSRHEILRTSFSDPKRMSLEQLPVEISSFLGRLKGGEHITPKEMSDFINRLIFGPSIFHQSIHPRVTLSIVHIDLDNFSPETRESELVRIGTQAIETPFDYENPPLIRALLFKRPSARYVLLIVMPHLLGDGWSLEIFNRELEILYEAYAEGAPCRLPEVSIQAVDFAAWQRRQLQGERLEELAAYWKQRWSEFSLFDVRSLPFAKSSTAPSGFIVETVTQSIDASLCADLRLVLHERNLTLHMVWLAALNVLLHMHTGQERIGVWGLFANRMQAETENLMAWLATGHIIGVHLVPEQRMNDVLTQVREVMLEAQAHQALPAALRWSHSMKDLTSNPGSRRAPVQPHISFVTETRAPAKADAPIKDFEFPYRVSQLDLNIVLTDSGDELQMIVQYSAARFSSESIGQMMVDWQQIVRTMVDAPSRTVAELAAILQLA